MIETDFRYSSFQVEEQMAQQDLTTLAAVKQYSQSTGSNPTTQDDPMISSLITGASQLALNYLSRPTILSARRTDIFTGTGGSTRPLRYQPVTAVYGVSINRRTVQPMSLTVPNGQGFTFDPWDGIPPGSLQALRLSGFRFDDWGPNNCQVDYQAGYAATEALKVPVGAPPTLTPISPYGMLLRDEGVVYTSSGLALVAVSSAPALGQYIPPNPLAAANPTTVYTFNALEANALVSITYSFVPSALELAIRLWVTDIYKYRMRIGEKSASEGGVQTTSYNIVAIPDVTKLALLPFNTVNFLT